MPSHVLCSATRSVRANHDCARRFVRWIMIFIKFNFDADSCRGDEPTRKHGCRVCVRDKTFSVLYCYRKNTRNKRQARTHPSLTFRTFLQLKRSISASCSFTVSTRWFRMPRYSFKWESSDKPVLMRKFDVNAFYVSCRTDRECKLIACSWSFLMDCFLMERTVVYA